MVFKKNQKKDKEDKNDKKKDTSHKPKIKKEDKPSVRKNKRE